MAQDQTVRGTLEEFLALKHGDCRCLGEGEVRNEEALIRRSKPETEVRYISQDVMCRCMPVWGLLEDFMELTLIIDQTRGNM